MGNDVASSAMPASEAEASPDRLVAGAFDRHIRGCTHDTARSLGERPG
ncbi:hypothetical protein [Kaistia sp. 32K]|nr:hypothetical protein [Kaistia sp. 32K]